MKSKLIIVLVALLLIASVALGFYFYLKSKDDKVQELNRIISDQNSVILNQNNVIDGLKCDIENIKKQTDDLKSALDATNDYIHNIENIRSESAELKQVIYEEIIADESGELQDWFNQKLPSNLINTLNNAVNTGVCEDSN